MALVTTVEAVEASVLVGTDWTLLYPTASDINYATLSIRAVSLSMGQDIQLQVAVVPYGQDIVATPPTTVQLIQPLNIVLGPGGIATGILEDTGKIIGPSRKIVMKASVALITGHVHGLIKKTVTVEG